MGLGVAGRQAGRQVKQARQARQAGGQADRVKAYVRELTKIKPDDSQ